MVPSGGIYDVHPLSFAIAESANFLSEQRELKRI
jgi:hypothetical protein